MNHKLIPPIHLAISFFLIILACSSDQTPNLPSPPLNTKCDPKEDKCLSDKEVSICSPDGKRIAQWCKQSEKCFNAKCNPISCSPYEITKCLENGQYEGCNPMGTGMGIYDPPENKTCHNGKFIDRICTPEQGICQDEDTLLKCNDAGTAYTKQISCSKENPKTFCEKDKCISLCDKSIKFASYIGCEYWTVDLDNAIDNGHFDAAGQPFAVVLSNTTTNATAEVQIFDKKSHNQSTPKPILNFSIPPKELRIIYLPNKCYDGNKRCPDAYKVNGTNISDAAFLIKSDLPITAAQFNPLENVKVYSNDASLLFPKTALGKRYMILTRKQHYDDFKGFVTIVATEPGITTLSFKTTAKTSSGIDRNASPIPAMDPGDTQIFKLLQFDALNIETNQIGADLTGSLIDSDKNVAVFAGVEATSIPETTPVTCCADHLEHQQYPIQAWGKHYNAVKTSPRKKERDLWRILARTDNTQVTITPNDISQPFILNSGQFMDILTEKSFEITSNHPILVGQFMAGQNDPLNPITLQPDGNSAGIGDPTYIIGVPVEQYRTHYAFLVPSKYEKHFITIIAPKDTKVVLDGQTLNNNSFFSFGSSNFLAKWIECKEGAHYIEASKPIGVFVYGYDNYVSYGYPAGLDLKDLYSQTTP